MTASAPAALNWAGRAAAALTVALAAACAPGGAPPTWTPNPPVDAGVDAQSPRPDGTAGTDVWGWDGGAWDGDVGAEIRTPPLPDAATADVGPDDAGVDPATLPTRYPPGSLLSPINRYVADHLRLIASLHPAQQDDVFMKVGASSTVTSTNLECFASDHVDLADHGYLLDALTFFLDGDADGTNPFERDTKAAKIGMSAVWAIGGDPSPVDQEMADISPRYAFVHYGTNDMGLGSTYLSAVFPFANNYLTLVDTLIAHGVIPVLMAIAARGDKTSADWMVDTYNNVIRGIGEARQVPFLDLHLALDALPGDGLAGDGIHLNVYKDGGYRPCVFTEEGLSYGMNVRNFGSLVALDALHQTVVLGTESLDEGVPLLGLGTSDDPILIDSLPFSHLADTEEALQSALDVYTGCDATQDESGGEVIYRLDVTEPLRVRALVLDRGDVDVDLHLLDETATEAGCMARAHQSLQLTLDPGTWHFALDTFVSAGIPKGGEYLFTLVRCDDGDPGCD